VVQQGNIIEVLPIGSRVQILVQGQGWNLVSKDYIQVGWVASPLMSVQQTAAVVQPAPVSVPAQAVPSLLSGNTVAAPVPLVDTVPVLNVQPEKTYGIVQLNSNLRAGPMQAILQVVPKGTQVEILLEDNTWYNVRAQDGSTGWIAGWLIEPLKHTTQVQTAGTQQQVGIVPATINTQELNAYWVLKVNELRSAAGLRLLQSNDVLVKTAATWADYMGTIKQLTHNRANGSSMHAWAEQQGIPFANRYAPNGWDTNYFTENIGRHLVYATMEEAKAGLDRILASFVAENNGPHYRTVYHSDWNSVGAGFYFDPASAGKYQMYVALHYASLAQ
jgi:uncharacterized protein YkwD